MASQNLNDYNPKPEKGQSETFDATEIGPTYRQNEILGEIAFGHQKNGGIRIPGKDRVVALALKRWGWVSHGEQKDHYLFRVTELGLKALQVYGKKQKEESQMISEACDWALKKNLESHAESGKPLHGFKIIPA